jgi:hypothetical protein
LTITIGGIATIVAVATVCLFLVWVVLPLLGGGTAGERTEVPAPGKRDLLCVAEDPYRHLGWSLQAGGELTAFATADGRVLAREGLWQPR